MVSPSTGVINLSTSAPAGRSATQENGSLRVAQRSGLIHQVIDQLRVQITSGAWPVGSRIPTEAELAQLTGTSRNTVREAVQSLVHAGLLERRQGSGTYVLADNELAGAVSRRISGARDRDVLEVRKALEVAAARLAAERRTDEDVVQLRELLRRRNQVFGGGDEAATVAADLALHRAIGHAAHNAVLLDLYDNLLDALHDNIAGNLQQGHDDDDGHSKLVEAIVAGDGESAAVEAGRFLDVLLDTVEDPV